MTIKLTDAQLGMLHAAAQRDDRCLNPAPTLRSAVARKVGDKLVAACFAFWRAVLGSRDAGDREIDDGHLS
jgi:hypothetical protein